MAKRPAQETDVSTDASAKRVCAPATANVFHFKPCFLEVGMGRLGVECRGLGSFLTALFEFEHESAANVQREEASMASRKSSENHPKIDSPATVAAWKAQLQPGLGHWVVHMRLLGLSRYFLDRVEAQIFIYETFRSKNEDVSLFNMNFLYVGDGTSSGAKRHGWEETLSVSVRRNANAIANQMPPVAACCVFWEDVPLPTAGVPYGCGPLEDMPSGVSMSKVAWRETFQEAWVHLRTDATRAFKDTKTKHPVDPVLAYELCYLQAMEAYAANHGHFREYLCQTYPVRLVYIPRDGIARQAVLWEKQRAIWKQLSPLDVSSTPARAPMLPYAENKDWTYFDKATFHGVVVLPNEKVVLHGLTPKQKRCIQLLDDWQQIALDSHPVAKARVPVCELCPSWQKDKPQELKQATREDVLREATAHALEKHGNFGKLEVLLKRPEWHTLYDREAEAPDAENLFKTRLKTMGAKLARMNDQGQLEVTSMDDVFIRTTGSM